MKVIYFSLVLSFVNFVITKNEYYEYDLADGYSQKIILYSGNRYKFYAKVGTSEDINFYLSFPMFYESYDKGISTYAYEYSDRKDSYSNNYEKVNRYQTTTGTRVSLCYSYYKKYSNSNYIAFEVKSEHDIPEVQVLANFYEGGAEEEEGVWDY